jgi:4,5-dihydroxyphthalate decarboxylase
MPDTPPRPMSLAAQRFDRTVPMFNRNIRVENIQAVHTSAGSASVEGLMRGIWDAAEIPVARYAFVRDQGDDFTAIPVFPDRIFVQPYAYTRTDTGINDPADLRGRRVVVPGFYYTASFWHRAILKEEHGVDASEIEWQVPGTELDERMRYPDGVSVTTIPRVSSVAQPLLEGSADVLLTEMAPVFPSSEEPRIKRIYPGPDAGVRDYYTRTGFFPPVHVIVVRKASLEQWPGFGEALCRMYDESKAEAYRVLQNERMTSLPLMRAHLDESFEMFGDDPWAYGLEANRAVLEKYLDLAHAEGFIKSRPAVEELFDERSLGYRFTAKMEHGSSPGGGAFVATNI